jgi:hypothetical protein
MIVHIKMEIGRGRETERQGHRKTIHREIDRENDI